MPHDEPSEIHLQSGQSHGAPNCYIHRQRCRAIIECGSDGFSARRARLLADAVNDGWSEQFDFLKVRP